MKYFLSLLCLFLLTNCSSNTDKTETKKYSDDTNRAFEMIERGGSYYLKKAPANTTPAPQIKKTTKPDIVNEKIVIDDKINYQDKNSEIVMPKPISHEKKKSSKVDERLIEINQHLAFYCMKHRKDSRFGNDEAKCMEFVNKIMTNCQKNHRDVNSQLLNCIQTKLKK